MFIWETLKCSLHFVYSIELVLYMKSSDANIVYKKNHFASKNDKSKMFCLCFVYSVVVKETCCRYGSTVSMFLKSLIMYLGLVPLFILGGGATPEKWDGISHLFTCSIPK